MDSGLQGSVVALTGASGGIGAATARSLVLEGARVVLHAHRHRDTAERLAIELGGAASAVVVCGDLREEDSAEAMITVGAHAFGRVDHVVVNAGIWPEDPVPLHRMALDRWQDTIESDLTSAFLTCRAFLRHLDRQRRESASIVLVASTAALFGEADHADYAAAKAALAYGLTRSLKNEIVGLAPRGRVNCVCPGWTRTPMTERFMGDRALLERVFSTMPLRKVATAADVAATITHLLSDRLAGHVSGAIVPVAGGMEGRRLDSS